ncbi:MAG TPA: hypothetical protein VHM91_08130, partial [Verrucomicrobiales bacterium]|nr:hypothetical protein [Verrucomicrobiales bacterium]
MKPLPTLLALAAVLISPVHAGDSFFSKDGKTVTFAPMLKTGILWRLDVASGKLAPLPLPAELKDESVTGVASGAEGETLFIAGPAVWVMKDDKVKRVVGIKPLKTAQNLFVANKAGSPLLDWLFVTGSEKEEGNGGGDIFYARKPGAKEFSEVFCRRVN